MNLKQRKLVTIVIISALMVACSNGQKQLDENTNFNGSSWKTIISESCMSFYDGCNDCYREKDGTVACTEMWCSDYGKPVCNDK